MEDNKKDQNENAELRPQNNLGGSSDNTPETATQEEADKFTGEKEKKADKKSKSQERREASQKKADKEESNEVSFETTRPVTLHVGKQKMEGTSFTFPKEVVEDRKRILKEAYGEDIIKE